MSQRREKRLRHLERRVAALEGVERERAERLERIQKANEAYWKERRSLVDASWKPIQARPQKGLLRRIVDFFNGR